MEVIEQALYGVAPGRGYGFLAVSPGFLPTWRAAAEKLCTSYGEPNGVSFPGAIFALPLVPGRIAIVEVRDQGTDDRGRPGALAFRILAVPLELYRDRAADPFWIAEQCPADWAARDSLPSLAPPALPPVRTVATLRPILQRDDSAFLLGGVQALLDGSRLFIPRARPEPELVRALWELVPTNSREDFWPCTFTFRPRPEFHIQVAPPGEEVPPGAIVEAQAAEYPEGRYESALLLAVETNDETEVANLLARRSRKQMLWLAWLLLALFLIVPISAALMPVPTPETPPSIERPSLPPTDEYGPLPETERRELAARLQAQPGEDLTPRLEAFAARLKVTPRGKAYQREALELQAAQLLGNPGWPALGHAAAWGDQLRLLGPVQRQLRFLLWRQGHAEYITQGPNTLELLEKLEGRRK